MSFRYLQCLFIIFMLQRIALFMTMNESVTFLKQMGYMGNGSMTDAVKMLQKQAGYPATGEIDEQTQMIMQMPMCGFIENMMDVARGPYHSSRWTTGNYSYRILDYPAYLSRKDVDKTIADAFSVWSQIIGRWFVKKRINANINITFKGNQTALSIGCIAASARYPVDYGHISFNQNIRWTLNDTADDCVEVNLYQTALHEIGHSIGLFHSSYPSSIMSPIIIDSKSRIHPNDMRRAKMKYDIDIPAAIRTKPVVDNEITPPICTLERMDAIVAYSINENYFNIYVFNGHQYWLVDAWTEWLLFDFIEYPKNITGTWKDLSLPIDTAFVDFENATYFFKGSMCWKYLSGIGTPAPGYPRSISEQFPGIPDDIDAATAYTENIICFIKGNKYWEFLIDKNKVEENYPQELKDRWNLDVNKLDAMLFFANYNEEMYFFKDMLYCRYVETNTPLQLTRDTKIWWFNC